MSAWAWAGGSTPNPGKCRDCGKPTITGSICTACLEGRR